MKPLSILFALASSSLSLSSLADSQNWISIPTSQKLHAAEKAGAQSLIAETLAILPPRVQQVLSLRKLELSFVELPKNAWGRIRSEGWFKSKSKRRNIELNKEFLTLFRAEAPSEEMLKASKAYGSPERLAMGSLLHEIAHHYDYSRAFLPDEARLLNDCQKKRNETLRLQNERRIVVNNSSEELKLLLGLECRDMLERQGIISDSLRFQALSGYKKKIFPKNENDGRLVNSYELESVFENFAVNFEFFLLDPSYRCRRPAYHQHFKEHFGWEPEGGDRCAPFPLADSRGKALRLDPSRVFEVQYLLAGKGSGIESRFGHSLLRFVVCRPGRQLGPECRLDREHHLTIAFLGRVDDLKMNPLKGLWGAYASTLIIDKFEHTLRQYTKEQLRSLESYPIKLSQTEVQTLVGMAVETFWTYEGSYYFLSRNCASEMLDLLQASIKSKAFQFSGAMSPGGVLKQLKKYGLVEKTSEPEIFPPHTEQLEKRFNEMTDALAVGSLAELGFENFLYRTTSEERREVYEAVLKKHQKSLAAKAKSLIAAGQTREAMINFITLPANFLYLENFLSAQAMASLEGQKSRLLVKFVESDYVPEENKFPLGFREAIAKLRTLREQIRQKALPETTQYGNPTDEELERMNDASAEHAEENEELSRAIGLFLDESFSDRVEDLKLQITNRNHYSNELKRLAAEFKLLMQEPTN